MRKCFPALLSVAIVLSAWQVWALTAGNPELVPEVPRLLGALGKWATTEAFYRSVTATLLRGAAGGAISLVAALITSVLFSRIPVLYEWFRPVLVSMRSVPVISFILFALIFLQSESIPLLIAFLTMFPLLSENLAEGIKQLQPGLAAFGKTFRLRRFNYRTQVLYPQIRPFLFSGLASAAGFGWRAVIMGEVLAQCASGIGGEMKRAQTFIDLPSLLGWTLVAVGVGYAADRGITAAAGLRIPVLYRKNNRVPDKLPEAPPPAEVLKPTIEEALFFRQDKARKILRPAAGCCETVQAVLQQTRQTHCAGGKTGRNNAGEVLQQTQPLHCRQTGDAAVVLKEISFAYGRAPGSRKERPDKTPVLRNFSYTFEKGCIYGLSAPSGTGKSTLLLVIAGLVRPDSGSVTAVGETGMAFMFQEPELLPELSVRENIALPLASLWNESAARREADRCLRLTETEALAGRLPSALSYGQRQRIALARALAYPSPVLLLDEPFKGLDRELAGRIMTRIRERRHLSGQTIIFASHKAGELETLADKILRIV